MALVKNKKVVETVGELREWLKEYSDDTPLCDDMGPVRVQFLEPQSGEVWETELGMVEIDNE